MENKKHNSDISGFDSSDDGYCQFEIGINKKSSPLRKSK
jgi:hypothetical protein